MAGASGLVVTVVLGFVCALGERNQATVEALSLKTRSSAQSNALNSPGEQDTDQGFADPVGEAEGQARPEAEVRQASASVRSYPGNGGSNAAKAEEAPGTQEVGTGFGFSELHSMAASGWGSLLEYRLGQEMFSYTATQAVLLIDGGSSKTQPVLFKMTTTSRPGMPRTVDENSIVMIGEGTKREGVRSILEKFLDKTMGDGWESAPLESDQLTELYDVLEDHVTEFVSSILGEAAALLNKHLPMNEQITAKMLGVPVLFNSTAGIRAFPQWCASGLFVAIRHHINARQAVEGYKFYTDPTLSRTLSGEEEGISAFLTANLLLHYLRKIKQDADDGLVTVAHEELAGIVEVGGASMQIVLPLSVTVLPPASVHVVDMQQNGYLSREYPPVHVLAVSYMQLGANSASGAFLKGLCSKAPFLKDGVCYNPCLHKNFEQDCSAGPVTITPDGQVVVDKDLKRNRLRPLATYCGEANEDVARRHTTRLTCLAAGMNPTGSTLSERVTIPQCTRIVGTGDFGNCVRNVDNILLNTSFALPANTEAEGIGFDAPGQIFATLSSSAPLLVTGASVVFPLRNLQKLGLLTADFSGDPEQLLRAASAFCNAPMQKSGSKLVVQVGNAELTLDQFTYEDCLRLAFTYAFLIRLNSGKHKPFSVNFSTKIVDPTSGKVLGGAGWPVGRIFKEVQDREQWRTRAYENGPVYATGYS